MDKTSIFDNLPIEESFNFSKAFVHMSDVSQQNSEQFYLDRRQTFRRDRIDSEDMVFLLPMPRSNRNEMMLEIENQQNFQSENTTRKRKNSTQSVEESNCLAEFRVL